MILPEARRTRPVRTRPVRTRLVWTRLVWTRLVWTRLVWTRPVRTRLVWTRTRPASSLFRQLYNDRYTPCGKEQAPPAGSHFRHKLTAYHHQPMALLIASDLHKDIAGQPLLRGVSLKLERRERMTVAGRNGTGKTTLLRMLAGETSIDRGELSVAKGMRIALHDQRPPRERGLALREYL